MAGDVRGGANRHRMCDGGGLCVQGRVKGVEETLCVCVRACVRIYVEDCTVCPGDCVSQQHVTKQSLEVIALFTRH